MSNRVKEFNRTCILYLSLMLFIFIMFFVVGTYFNIWGKSFKDLPILVVIFEFGIVAFIFLITMVPFMNFVLRHMDIVVDNDLRKKMEIIGLRFK